MIVLLISSIEGVITTNTPHLLHSPKKDDYDKVAQSVGILIYFPIDKPTYQPTSKKTTLSCLFCLLGKMPYTKLYQKKVAKPAA